MGSVLVMLALLAGFAAPIPASRVALTAPARGPLIDATNHPEWRQFVVRAAYRRAEELSRLLTLPSTPTVLSVEPPSDRPPPPAESAGVPVAGLPAAGETAAPSVDPAAEDLTGSIDSAPAGNIQIDIGEASSTELPLRDRDVPPPVRSPSSLKPARESLGKTVPRPRVSRPATHKTKPAQAVEVTPDFFTSLLGKTGAAAPAH